MKREVVAGEKRSKGAVDVEGACLDEGIGLQGVDHELVDEQGDAQSQQAVAQEGARAFTVV